MERAGRQRDRSARQTTRNVADEKGCILRPPDMESAPLAARMTVPVDGTVTCAAVADPPYVSAWAPLGQTAEPSHVTTTTTRTARQDPCSFIGPPLRGIFGEPIEPVYYLGGFVRTG
jgi:hypothetical protein